MEVQVRLLVISHAVVLVLAAVGGFVWAGVPGILSVSSGFLSFSVPVIVFSAVVLRASSADPGRFWGRFMVGELIKWALSALFLALAFSSGWFQPLPLMAGFFLSVLVQMVYPILAKRGSES
jgi:F0F1-type ATP synthase assembly protein I